MIVWFYDSKKTRQILFHLGETLRKVCCSANYLYVTDHFLAFNSSVFLNVFSFLNHLIPQYLLAGLVESQITVVLQSLACPTLLASLSGRWAQTLLLMPCGDGCHTCIVGQRLYWTIWVREDREFIYRSPWFGSLPGLVALWSSRSSRLVGMGI